jgi:hypothetical protein
LPFLVLFHFPFYIAGRARFWGGGGGGGEKLLNIKCVSIVFKTSSELFLI